MLAHGEIWTLKELFVYPNEFVYWGIQIVMYPFMTGLVAGAFVLSSLYHVFDIKQLKGIAKFSLVFSFALLGGAPLPLLFHLMQPQRGLNVFMTPHFTSAIAAFGVIFTGYSMLVASEIWFLYRQFFVETALALEKKLEKTFWEKMKYCFYASLTLGAFDISEKALKADHKAIKILAGVGIPLACFLHGYAGFIFGSVKANALWMTPLMPVIFIMSAIVSGIALCMFTYILSMEIRKSWVFRRQSRPPLPVMVEAGRKIAGVEVHVIRMTSKYLLFFMVFAISLELLDLIFRGYTAVKSWDVLRSVIYGADFINIFILQYGLGNLLPLILLLLPNLTIRRTFFTLIFVMFGVFMMRWNVVIGGQAFSLTFSGYMHYLMPIIPHNIETYREGLLGAVTVGMIPFLLFVVFSKILPVFEADTKEL